MLVIAHWVRVDTVFRCRRRLEGKRVVAGQTVYEHGQDVTGGFRAATGDTEVVCQFG